MAHRMIIPKMQRSVLLQLKTKYKTVNGDPNFPQSEQEDLKAKIRDLEALLSGELSQPDHELPL